MKNHLYLLLLCALLVFVPSTFAQDETFGLSEADYALLTEANTALGEISTLRFDYAASMAISGVPDATGTLSLEGSGVLITGDNFSMEVALNGQNDLAGQPSIPLQAELRIVDGIVYVNVVDRATNQSTGWTGQALEELGGLVPASETTVSPEMMALALAVLQPQQWISMQREADATAAGREAAHFVVEVDLDTMFNAPFMDDVIAGAMENAAPVMADAPTAAELAALLAGSTVRFEEWIGLDDGRVHRMLFDTVFNISPRAMGMSGDDMVVAFTFDMTLDQFNETVSIVAPEDAILLTAGAADEPVVNPVAPLGGIAANTPFIVSLSGQAAFDYIYTSAGNETITVTARSMVANTVDTTLEVISPGGLTLAFNDDRSLDMTDTDLGAFDSAVLDLRLAEAGDYIIRVGSYNNTGIGEIELLVQSDAPPVITTVVTPVNTDSEIVSGALTPDGAFAYSFTASAGETLTIAARDVSGTLDPVLLLMDSRFTGLAENDDHATGDSMLDPLDAKIEDFVAPDDGTYHLVVSDVDGAGGVFQLVIIRGGGLVSDFEDIEPITAPVVNDPNAIQPGDSMTFLLDGAAPGMRTFYATAGQQITITATATDPADMDIYLTVFAADGTPIAFNDDHLSDDATLGQRDAQILTLTLPVAGAYRIEVDSWFDLSGEVAVAVEEG